MPYVKHGEGNMGQDPEVRPVGSLASRRDAVRMLNSAYIYLCLSWTLNNPDDPRNFAQWFEQEPEGQAANLLACLAAS